MNNKLRISLFLLLIMSPITYAWEIDGKVKLDENGFWGAHYDLPKIATVTTIATALYLGNESRLGKTVWKSLDAGIMSQVITEGSKSLSGRLRPRHTDSPSKWNKGGASFFSGHVSGMTALVTPLILEYRSDNRYIDLLWLLPLHQMGGRVKAQAHWQSDVIAGALAGYATGYWAWKRESPLILHFDKDKIFFGFENQFK